MVFNEPDFARWLSTGKENLAVARHAADGGFHASAVFHSEQAAQCVLKALLHGVGRGEFARGHGLLELQRSCEAHAGLGLEESARESLGTLARNYLTSRYPDALPEGTPGEHYGRGSSNEAIGAAEHITDAVEECWSALLAEAEASEDEG